MSIPHVDPQFFTAVEELNAAVLDVFTPPGTVGRLASDEFGHPGIVLRTRYLESLGCWAHLVAVGVSLRGPLDTRDGAAIVLAPGARYGGYCATRWSVFTASRVAWYGITDVQHLKSGPARASEELRERLDGILVGRRHYLASAKDPAHIGAPIAFEANP